MGMTDDELDVLGGGFKEMGGSGVGYKVDLLAEMKRKDTRLAGRKCPNIGGGFGNLWLLQTYERKKEK